MCPGRGNAHVAGTQGSSLCPDCEVQDGGSGHWNCSIHELPSLLEPYLKMLGHHHFGDHTNFLFLILPVCHQRSDHGGSGSGLSHRQHPSPTQRLSAPEGSKAVTGRKRVLEPDLKSPLHPALRPLRELLGPAALKPAGEHCFHLQLEQEVLTSRTWGSGNRRHSCGCALRIKGYST